MPKKRKIVEKTLYRMDFRAPSIILSEGFAGTNNTWMNTIYGANTVFCARSLRGVSRFFLESVFNEAADGSKAKGPLDSDMSTIYKKPDNIYVYTIKSSGLESVDVIDDLSTQSKFGVNPHSKIMGYIEEQKNEGGVIGFDEEYWEKKLRLYLNKCAIHTEEVIVKGPIAPKLITLYQTMPLTKVF